MAKTLPYSEANSRPPIDTPCCTILKIEGDPELATRLKIQRDQTKQLLQNCQVSNRLNPRRSIGYFSPRGIHVGYDITFQDCSIYPTPDSGRAIGTWTHLIAGQPRPLTHRKSTRRFPLPRRYCARHIICEQVNSYFGRALQSMLWCGRNISNGG